MSFSEIICLEDREQKSHGNLMHIRILASKIAKTLCTQAFCSPKSLPCSVALVLLFAKSLPCSVAIKVLGVTSAPALSRVTFSSIWGFVVFVMLHIWRSRALFSDSLWPPVPFQKGPFFRLGVPALYFPICGALLFSVFGTALGCLGLSFASLGSVGPG